MKEKEIILKLGRGRWSQGNKQIFRTKANILNLEQAAHSKKEPKKQIESLLRILNPKSAINQIALEEGIKIYYKIDFLSQTPKGNIKNYVVTKYVKEFKIEETFYLKVGKGRWKQKKSKTSLIPDKAMKTIQESCFSRRKTTEEQTSTLEKALNHPSIFSRIHLSKFYFTVDLFSESPKGNVRVYKVSRIRHLGIPPIAYQRARRGKNASKLRSSLRQRSKERIRKLVGVEFLDSFDELMGCNKNQLLKWIESQWEPWMSWANYVNNKLVQGEKYWSIDHIIAFCHPDVDLTTIEGQRRVLSYKNIIPLEASENLLKGNLTMTEWVKEKPFYFFNLSNNFDTFA